ncbi:HSPB1-associated protein 1 [Toxorhynchites rutilus septentrionalis]|uniref:HSPB1-associated protein 1 n=1 Tax=Toxorhynchites rutilus septentrionalis TaxID=329112 RepID=UPI002479F9B3|nr:HSPB1-associated protein 1 [Toxorhynchites rutilus septentrionalis]
MDPNMIRDIVLNTHEPVTIKNFEIPWNCFSESFPQWLSFLDKSTPNDGFVFDTSSLRNGDRPQWERKRGKIRMTMADFHRNANSTAGHFKINWASYSYRCISELPEKCRRGVDFKSFGFPDATEDISFWIGSKGSHTPCHYDTYGCNIVVQVYGRKSWLLFPPDAKLKQTRVPYEESSVYCEENFYSPERYSAVIDVENDAYCVTLEPGMTLIVPPKWWHFVESLETSLNFNTWIPLEKDTEEQISECLTRLIVLDYAKNLTTCNLKHIINPNELTMTTDPSSGEELQLTLEHLLNQRTTNKRQRTTQKRYLSGYLQQTELSHLLSRYNNFITIVPKLTSHNFFHMMKRNSLRYDSALNGTSDDEGHNRRIASTINSACNPTLIKLVKDIL